jgi:type II secretory pathway predicted ATPase ExeA
MPIPEYLYQNFFAKTSSPAYVSFDDGKTKSGDFKVKKEDHKRKMTRNDFNIFENKLIVFEGTDFTGKTSVAKLFADVLNDKDIPAIYTFQPGDSNYGTLAPVIRSLCKDKRWGLHPLSLLSCVLYA